MESDKVKNNSKGKVIRPSDEMIELSPLTFPNGNNAVLSADTVTSKVKSNEIPTEIVHGPSEVDSGAEIVTGISAVQSTAVSVLVDPPPLSKDDSSKIIFEATTPPIYSSWSSLNGACLTCNQIEATFKSTGEYYGFQNDNVANMFHFFMTQLNSRSCRMLCGEALLSLHSDYIAGQHANYRQWCFVTQSFPESEDPVYHWKSKISTLSESEMVLQLSLYLLIWGEASNIRYMPECLCFLFHCALQYSKSNDSSQIREYNFLEAVITPLYNVLLHQSNKRSRGRDHSGIIGYDDINLFFWHQQNINSIKLMDGSKFIEKPDSIKYIELANINWSVTFYKTYREKRSWMHLITNFSRIWILHFSTYWYFTSLNSTSIYTINYIQLINNQPPPQLKLTIVSLGGAIACILQLMATLFECTYVPRRWPGSQNLTWRFLAIFVLLAVNVAPTVYILLFIPMNAYSVRGYYISIGQLVFSILTTLYLSVIPSSKLFFAKADNAVAQFAVPNSKSPSVSASVTSILLWVLVFTAKFLESYFFLTLAVKDSIRALAVLETPTCYGDALIGNILCRKHHVILLVLVYVADLILFLLDTYLWYVILSSLLSVFLSFTSGVSIFTPWKSGLRNLPQKIDTALLHQRILVSKSASNVCNIWNAIILSMYRENILSLKQANDMIFEQNSESTDSHPLFSASQESSDNSKQGHEASRRISFFAKSLSMNMPKPLPTSALPNFTVLIPHYSEKILLGFDYLLKIDKSSRLTPLEYLQRLKKEEWMNFVQDAKIVDHINKERSLYHDVTSQNLDVKSTVDSNYDIPFSCMGFKELLPLNIMRTRIWASLRTQTLYRTIAGFMNYEKAILLLHDSEVDGSDGANTDFLREKCRVLVAMQKYFDFTEEEKADADFLFETFPSLMVATIEKKEVNGALHFFSVLLDTSQKQPDGSYLVKYRVKLPGNPIMGDGKADNQNSSLIFYRGEYIEVVDSNQDNYLEECMKIKSVLAEFEEYEMDRANDYNPSYGYTNETKVAIVGAREYIFSENIGILGDVAASKEQTFGTLFARTLAHLNAKLHYGHPDFMNGIFMTTRGGISKAQKGLHLNEDIYAGMNAISRGGRIKHCDYHQCGKGRDLGFTSVLNFTRKIGAGMGEQILSREHFYLGTHLSIDRFLSFYYAHPGFHINNLLIFLSVQAFMLIILNLGAINHESIICKWEQGIPLTNLLEPLGCSNLKPIFLWIKHYVLSVVVCFVLSFTPVFVHLLMESGPLDMIKKISTHLLCLSPLFEVFLCQVYAKSLNDDITYGSAKYIGTDRAMSIKRLPFSMLYSYYASDSIYGGGVFFLVLVFATLTVWQPCLLWFWITVVSLLFAPFIFNPHQFAIGDFFLDYRDFIRWLSRGNSKGHSRSWVGFTKNRRSNLSGYKRGKGANINMSSLWNVFLDQIIRPLIVSICFTIPYIYINSQHGVKSPIPVNVLLRLAILVCFPIVFNCIVLVALAALSLILGTFCNPAKIIAGVAHMSATVVMILILQTIFILEGENFPRGITLLLAFLQLQSFLFRFISWSLPRELHCDSPNRTWWSGKFWRSGLKFKTLPYMAREYFVKILEQNLFALDFIYGHFLLFAMFPIVIIPGIDNLHTSLLIWVSPFKLIPKVYGKRESRTRRSRIFRYGGLFILQLIVFVAFIVAPIYLQQLNNNVSTDLRRKFPSFVGSFIQPVKQNNNYTGENAEEYVLRAVPELAPMITVA